MPAQTNPFPTDRQARQFPPETWGWNLYGAGLENLGRQGQMERFPLSPPAPNQLLVRVDCVSLCYSDIKILQQGGQHPKLYGRDLSTQPTRLGHEAALTVLAVGAQLAGQYYPGQRLAVQPDIYQGGRSAAYGHAVPGALIQHHLIGPELLETDHGACLLPLSDQLGYAEAALLEPWGCVLAAYTQRRRLVPKMGGTMLILGRPDDPRPYLFSAGLEAPRQIVLVDAPASLRRLAAQTGAHLIERRGLTPAALADLAQELTGGAGFDDLILLAPRAAEVVGQLAGLLARGGVLNLVGEAPLDGEVLADLGRLHYDALALVGNRGPDIAASYGAERNRSEVRPGGTALIVGAGGPMGQMHAQRLLELPHGPQTLIALEISPRRLAALRENLTPLAQAGGRTLHLVNPAAAGQSLSEAVLPLTGGEGADDVVVCVPNAALMAEAARLMKPDGLLVLFAGVPKGTLGPLDLSRVYLHGAQYTGTSGLTLPDQAAVMQRTLAGELRPAHSVAAIAGLKAVPQALQAVMEGRYAGKVVIYPPLPELPLLGLEELAAALPAVAAQLEQGRFWSRSAEAALFAEFGKMAA